MSHTMDLANILVCKDCRVSPPNIVEDYKAGDLVCGDCGLVFPMRIIDQRQEWRTFADATNSVNMERTGQAENSLYDGVYDHLSTSISVKNGNAALSRVHAQVSGTVKGNKDLQESFSAIGELCDRIGVNKLVADTARQFYKQCWDAGTVPSCSIAACVFVACRQQGVARTFAEMSKLADVDLQDLTRSQQMVTQFLQEQQIQSAFPHPAFNSMQSSSTLQMVPRLCSVIGLDVQQSRLVEHVVERVEQLSLLTGRSPGTVVGACIMLVMRMQGIDQEDKISLAVNITRGTLERAYKLIQPHVAQLQPADFTPVVHFHHQSMK